MSKKDIPSGQDKGRDDKGRFLPGVSGNPGGMPKRKIITDQIVSQLDKVNPADKEGRTNLQILVDALVEQANKGKLHAISLIADRVEGKAVTPVDISGGLDINGNAKELLDARIATIVTRRRKKEGTD